MPNRFNLRGVAELRDAFARVPAELRDDAEPIVSGKAEDAAERIRADYPEVTGRLRRGVRTESRPGGSARATTRVVSSAPHAHLYEYGTIHSRAFPTFWPITTRARADMVREVADMVRSHGFTVTGDTA